MMQYLSKLKPKIHAITSLTNWHLYQTMAAMQNKMLMSIIQASKHIPAVQVTEEWCGLSACDKASCIIVSPSAIAVAGSNIAQTYV